MSVIVTTTKPNLEGEMLWCVHYKSSYYDDDARMPGVEPVDSHIFVLAKGRDEAISKAEAKIAEARKRKGKDAKEEIEATIITIENLVPSRDGSKDGRMGYTSTAKLKPIELSCPEDTKRYRLGVCLIPVNQHSIPSNLIQGGTLSEEKWPPISPGTLVRTDKENESIKDWTEEAKNSRQWNILGEVITHHDSHGLCYKVRHPDGSFGFYDPTELVVV